MAPLYQLPFTGAYSPIFIDGEDRSLLYLGADNKLYYPDNVMIIGSCRAYFGLKGITASDLSANAIFMNFDGENATGIVDTTIPPGGSQPPVWRGASGYDLSGRKLSGKPTAKGIYINSGKKVVVK